MHPYSCLSPSVIALISSSFIILPHSLTLLEYCITELLLVKSLFFGTDYIKGCLLLHVSTQHAIIRAAAVERRRRCMQPLPRLLPLRARPCTPKPAENARLYFCLLSSKGSKLENVRKSKSQLYTTNTLLVTQIPSYQLLPVPALTKFLMYFSFAP